MNEDLDLVVDNARDVLAREWDPRTMHRFFDGEDALEDGLLELARRLGWLTAPLPEEAGGLGLGTECGTALLREAGRVCAPGAIFAALAADLWICAVHQAPGMATLVEMLADHAHSLLLPGIEWTPLPLLEIAVKGSVEGMIGGRSPTLAILPVNADGAGAIAVVPLGSSASFERGNSWDGTRAIGWLHCDGVQALATVPDPDGRLLAELKTALRLAVAADSMGGAERALEETLAYTLQREQFGRRIASFQAIKHRVASMRINCEVPEALLKKATGALGETDGTRQQWAMMARLSCGDYYRFMADESVLLHGGIGYTWEMDPHVRVKRAGLNALLCGNERTLRDDIFAELVLAAGIREDVA